jgi:DNA-binding GntR family transcriptional regulator
VLDKQERLSDGTLAPYRNKFSHLGRAADVVREALREAILAGDLDPGTRLREEEIARIFGVSRTPVREALQHLRSEELVELSPNQGVTVTRLTTDDILAIYLVRESLEGLASRLAAQRATASDGERLQQILREMDAAVSQEKDVAFLSQLNLRFHAEIRRIANNRYLDRFLGQVEHAVHRFGQTTYAYQGRRADSVQEHRGIVEAIMAGDPQRAEYLASEHMRAARRLRLQMLMDGLV